MTVGLLTVVIIIGLLILGGVFVEPITGLIRQRFLGFAYEGDIFLIWGGLIISAFVLGLLVMYLLLHLYNG